MSATLVTPKTTSGGEIVRELVNSSDGAGLHFDGSAGNISFTPVDLGSKFSHEFVIKADEDLTTGSSSYIIDYEGGSGRFVIGAEPTQAAGNLAIYDDAGWKSFGVNPLTDLKVHHLVVTVDGTSAVLYDNGNQVGTATINANHGIDNATAAAIGSNFFTATSNNFEGVIYRCRTYNKALTSAEVQTAFERSDVPFADQYGSQTYIIDSSFASSTQSFNGAGGTTAANIDSIGGQNDTLRFTTDSSTGNHQILRTCPRDKGKNVRVQGMVYIPSTNTNIKKVQVNENGNADIAVIKEITTLDAWVSFDEIHVWTDYDELRFRGLKADGTTSYAGNGSDVFYIKNIKVNYAGCVSDYQTQWANPSQSLTVQDASGAADGTCSASGVTQVQPVVQLNSTSARIGTSAATPADGEIIAKKGKFDGDNSATPLTVNGGTLSVPSVQLNGGTNQDDNSSIQAKYSLVLASNSTDAIANRSIVFKNGTATQLTLDANGAVGLARTATSGYRLDVHGRSGYDDVVLIEGNGTNMGPRINLTPTGTGTSRINATANDLALQTGGTSHLIIDSSGNVTVNEAAGSATNSTKLEVRSDANGSTSAIRTTNKDQTAGTNQAAGVDFGLSRNSGAFKPQAGQIKVGRQADWSASDTNIDAYMAFSTYNDNALGERMRIAANGSTTFQKSDGAIVNLLRNDTTIADGNTFGRLQALSGDSNHTAGTEVGSIVFKAYGDQTGTRPRGQIRFQVANNAAQSEAMRIEPDKKVEFFGGIQFGSQTDTSATGAAASGTILDHYEEGTFTLTDASGAGLSLVNGAGKYTRIGDRVFITVSFSMPTITNGSHMVVSGLPFPVEDSNDSRGLVLNYSNKADVKMALTVKNTDDINFFTSTGSNSTCTNGSAGDFYINGHYKV